MAKEKLCVFNLTQQSFLSLGVGVADTHFSRLRGLLGRTRLRSGEGLWVIPCQGIHTIGMLFPIDVVYLDENLRVIHLIESLAPFRISPLRRTGRSILELPPRTIFMSHTQVGDQFLICTPEEFEEFWQSQPEGAISPPQPVAQGSAPGPGNGFEPVVQPQPAGRWSWFRWLWPHSRAPRYTNLALDCYHWSGGVPKHLVVENISETGAYLRTEERWHPGTVLELTIQARHWIKDEERWFCRPRLRVLSQVVRCDEGGVGIRFVWTKPEQVEQIRRLLATVRNAGPQDLFTTSEQDRFDYRQAAPLSGGTQG